jgi:hypothetical protein
MRYWLSIGDGRSQGPFDVDELERMAKQGRLPVDAELCEVGSDIWEPAVSVIEMPVHLFPPTSPAGIAPIALWTPVSLVGPILTTICCCLIGGIVSIVYAANANAKGAAGDVAGAQRDAASSKSWMTASVVIGAIIGLIYFFSAIAANSR